MTTNEERPDLVLAVLRRHSTCSHCRMWMKTDKYHEHVAQIVARWLSPAAADGGA